MNSQNDQSVFSQFFFPAVGWTLPIWIKMENIILYLGTDSSLSLVS